MYQVQVSRYKGSYKTRWSFDNLSQALFWYDGINVFNGYNKRVLDPEGSVITRVRTG